MSWIPWQVGIRAWVAAASGLGLSRVAWAGQAMPRPAKPFIALRVKSLSRGGHDWVAVDDTDEDAIVYLARGTRAMILQMTAFSDDAVGAAQSVAILDRVLGGATLPTASAALMAAGVGIGEWLPIQMIDGLVNFTAFEARAQVDVLLHLVTEVSETANYIETVEITDRIQDPEVISYVPEDPMLRIPAPAIANAGAADPD